MATRMIGYYFTDEGGEVIWSGEVQVTDRVPGLQLSDWPPEKVAHEAARELADWLTSGAGWPDYDDEAPDPVMRDLDGHGNAQGR